MPSRIPAPELGPRRPGRGGESRMHPATRRYLVTARVGGAAPRSDVRGMHRRGAVCSSERLPQTKPRDFLWERRRRMKHDGLVRGLLGHEGSRGDLRRLGALNGYCEPSSRWGEQAGRTVLALFSGRGATLAGCGGPRLGRKLRSPPRDRAQPRPVACSPRRLGEGVKKEEDEWEALWVATMVESCCLWWRL